MAHLGTVVVGAARALTGLSFLVAPERAATFWVGDSSKTTLYLARAVATRDLTVGVGVLWALRAGRSPRPWLVASALADVSDAAFGATMLEADRRTKAIVLAGGFAVLGAVTAAMAKGD